MDNSFFIFFTIFFATAIAYSFYKLLWGAEKKSSNEELQITSKELLEELKILYKQNKHNVVQGLAKNYLEKKKDNVEVRKIYAKSLYEDKKLYEAITQAKIILEFQYEDEDIRLFLANCYEQVGKNNEAISLLQEILAHNPNNVLAIKNLAKIYNDTNQRISALKMYIRLNDFLENNQDKFNNHKIIASLYMLLKRYDFAINSYNDALAIYPDNVEVKKKLVDLYYKTQNTEEFVSLINDIKTSSNGLDDELWAMNKLLDYYMEIQNYDSALVIARALQENPLSDKIKVGTILAKIFSEQNELDEGVEVLLTLLEAAPDDIQLKKDLAVLYMKKCDFERASVIYKNILEEIDFREVKEINIELSNLYADWAMYLFEHEDNDACFKQFFTALEYYDKNPDIYYKLGNVNQLIKNLNEAISQYKKAIELNPKNADYYIAISQCYEEIGSVYEQKNSLVDSLKYSDTNPIVFYKLGVILQMQGDMPAAISYMEKAVELGDNYTDAMFKLALMYENIGKKDDAIILYDTILDINPDDKSVLSSLKMLKGE